MPTEAGQTGVVDVREARTFFPATSTSGRGVGYCYFSQAMQDRFTPINAGWKAGEVPFQSFFGPGMNFSTTASRFDNSISWLAAVGDAEPTELLQQLRQRNISCAARDGNLRLAVHLYNHEDDIDQVAAALAEF